jgi:AcrR family transcriptional regulator
MIFRIEEMAMILQVELERQSNKPRIEDDSAKRQQIIEGAHAVFLAQGFDAASMNDIARAAGVSKGTLYVYFQNKEQLFQAICGQECGAHAEGMFKFHPEDRDVEATLTRVGVDFVNFLCRPEKASTARTVIAIAERMPEIGKSFYETGPAYGIARLASYLESQVKAGVLAIDDCEIAAAQFIDSCQSTLFKPILYNFGEPPTPERRRYVVGIAVKTFLAAYRVR